MPAALPLSTDTQLHLSSFKATPANLTAVTAASVHSGKTLTEGGSGQ